MTEATQEQVTTPDADAQEFSKAFAEFANGPAPADDAPADRSDDDTEAAEVQAQEQEQEGGAQDAAAQTADSQPDNAQAEDIWQGLSDAQKAELQKLQDGAQYWQHRYNSDVGRVNSYQRKISELEAQVKAVRDSAVNSSEQPTNKEVKAALQSPEKWEQFQSDYPDIAEALDVRFAHQKSELDKWLDSQLADRTRHLQDEIKPLKDVIAHNNFQTQEAALRAAHPDYREVCTAAEFQSWLEQQPKPVKDLYESDEAADAAYLITTFKAMNRIASGQPSEAVKPNNRQSELAARVELPSKGVSRTAIDDGSFSSAFNAFAKQHDKNLRR